jgi:hypothetical protein
MVGGIEAMSVLRDCEELDVKLSLDGDNIVARGLLTDSIRHRIRENKAGLLALLRQPDGATHEHIQGRGKELIAVSVSVPAACPQARVVSIQRLPDLPAGATGAIYFKFSDGTLVRERFLGVALTSPAAAATATPMVIGREFALTVPTSARSRPTTTSRIPATTVSTKPPVVVERRGEQPRRRTKNHCPDEDVAAEPAVQDELSRDHAPYAHDDRQGREA